MKQSDYFEAATKHFRDRNFDKARELYESITLTDPTNTSALYNLGVTYLRLANEDMALQIFKKYAVLKPKDARAHLQMGIILFKKNNYSASLTHFKNALKFNPNIALAHLGLGIIYNNRGNTALAKKHLKKALELNPHLNSAYEHLYLISSKLCDWENLQKYEKILDKVSTEGIKNGSSHVETPFVNIGRIMDSSVNLTHAKFWSKTISSNIKELPAIQLRKRSTKDRIKVGYLSSDFRNHPIGQLVADIFKYHDRKNFEVFTYSYGRDDKSEIRESIKKHSEHFKDLSIYEHRAVAEMIQKDDIDILVDLVGYTGFSVPDITAYKPAPIQINYLGYPGTMGAPYYDYIIADKIVIPPSDAKYYSEKVLYLPNCYQFYSTQKIANKKFSKKDFKLPEDLFIFASFNTAWKIRQEDFDTWIRILKRVPKSSLWLYCPEPLAQKNLQNHFKKAGLSPSRLIFATKLPRPEHLARIGLADLVLDTFIYNGHTTTSDCLWAGVPVITLQGSHFASRVASSILKAVDLSSLITSTKKEYEDLAVSLAGSPKKLKTIRESLNKNRNTSPLFNPKESMKEIEKIYKEIWKNYLKNH